MRRSRTSSAQPALASDTLRRVEGLRDPVEVIRAHLARWQTPVVDFEIFGTTEPATIAGMIDAFCAEHLGADVAAYLFCHTSQGSTHGAELTDGRRVVVKARSLPNEAAGPLEDADRRLTHEGLRSVHSALGELARRGFACPAPILGPTALGQAVATVEEYQVDGELGDGSRPDHRLLIAEGQLEIGRILTPIRDELPGLRPFFQPAERLYPIPHSKLFDFEATGTGAEWIDEIAEHARKASIHPGPDVIGHADWRIQHVRFDGGRISASYDWDSILPMPETQLLGVTAHAFTTDWSSYEAGRVPTAREVSAFVDDYESARGTAFSAAERKAIFAMAVYSTAYGARCQHSLAPERAPGDWPADSWPFLLREAAAAFLA